MNFSIIILYNFYNRREYVMGENIVYYFGKEKFYMNKVIIVFFGRDF